MASPHACAALIATFPALARSKRAVVGHTRLAPVSALAAVAAAGPVRVSEVAELMGLDLSTVSRQVSHLRRDGLVESTPDADDGRSQRLSVTDAGRALLRDERHRMVDRLVERLVDWDDAELAEITALIGRLTADLSAAPQHHPETARPTATTARTA
ncbi:MarR family winged helix-turn-helix transcriptional regulator [Quadrisphaera setariae]|uniref:MarR family transcriptional regulator n=1 Tax=Quadrisphaera setariae TaxID=2593304 RepID=A0A5C8ZKR6_9ACTN|nr:MarR family transcriptional regulator [Quadrisphaera setariae]TXR57738.1 MarR family transcriptional regulator [Quadrisphaera setariae]